MCGIEFITAISIPDIVRSVFVFVSFLLLFYLILMHSKVKIWNISHMLMGCKLVESGIIKSEDNDTNPREIRSLWFPSLFLGKVK